MTKRLLSVEDGLSSREVFCGLQDRYGFNWFGTRNGLNRYDGKNMLLFNRQRNQLRQNKVINLAHDNHNLLFIQYGESGYHRRSSGIVDVMNVSTFKVKTLAETFHQMPFQEKDIIWIKTASQGRIHFLTSNPLRLWEYAKSYSNEFKLIYNLKEGKDPVNMTPAIGPYCFYPNTYATILYELPEGYLLAGPQKMVSFKTTNGARILPFAITPTHEYIMSYNSWDNEISHFAIINRQGKVEYNLDLKKYALTELDGKQFECTAVANDSSMVVKIFDDGIFLRHNGKLSEIIGKEDLPNYRDLSVYMAFTDKSKKLWMCTSMGVFQVKIKNNLFQHYLTEEQQQNKNKNQVRGIYVDSLGKLYANMWENLFILDGKNVKSASLSNNTNYMHLMYALHKHNGRLYVGGFYPLIYDETLNRIKELKNNYILQDIWSIYSLKDDLLLFGRNDDIEVYNIRTQQSKIARYKNPSFPRARFVYRFFKSKNGALWAVSENGLFQLDSQGTIIDYYGENKDSSHRLPYSNLTDVYEAKNGIFWLATNGDGLYQWNRKTNEFKQFKITEGLPSDILYRIEADAREHLWISSDNGLIQFNPHNFLIRTYTSKDGISSNEFNRVSSFKGLDGRMYFGGLNGVNAFYPSEFWSDTVPLNAPLQVISTSKFTVQDGLMIDHTNKLSHEGKIEIQPEDKFFRLEFMLLDFEKEDHKYAYQIEGLDKDWTYINENVVQLSGIPYGHYTLKIKGQNQSGQWSSNELIFPLTVVTPFYKRTIFIILSGIIFILSLVFIIKYRTHKLIRDNENLERTVNQRTEQLKELLKQKDLMVKEIHHRVKNNLQVISSLLEIQGLRTIDEKAKAALSETQNRVLSIALIHQNLYQHDNMKGVEISTFVTELSKHVSSVFSTLGNTVKVEQHIEDVFIDIDTAVPLGLIINELMTNSYKYAFAGRTSGKISIQIGIDSPGQYKLIYRDNGVGLPQGIELNQSKTLGLRLIKQLSKQLRGVMHYRYEEGSVFELTLTNSSIRTKTN